MLAKTLPLLLLCACAAAPQIGAPSQPALAVLAEPYAGALRSAGITRVEASGAADWVRLETLSGPVYVRYPQGMPAVAFALDIRSDKLVATSDQFDQARDQPVLDAILPAAIRATETNNILVWLHRNPWN